MNLSVLHQAPCTLPAYLTSGLKGNWYGTVHSTTEMTHNSRRDSSDFCEFLNHTENLWCPHPVRNAWHGQRQAFPFLRFWLRPHSRNRKAGDSRAERVCHWDSRGTAYISSVPSMVPLMDLHPWGPLAASMPFAKQPPPSPPVPTGSVFQMTPEGQQEKASPDSKTAPSLDTPSGSSLRPAEPSDFCVPALTLQSHHPREREVPWRVMSSMSSSLGYNSQCLRRSKQT